MYAECPPPQKKKNTPQTEKNRTEKERGIEKEEKLANFWEKNEAVWERQNKRALWNSWNKEIKIKVVISMSANL